MEREGLYRMYKKTPYLFAFLTFFFVPFFVKAEGLELSEEELRFISEHPVLDVVCDSSFPPFEYIDKNSVTQGYEGINISLLNKAAGLLGIKLNYIPTKNYDESILYFKEQKADIITGYLTQLGDFTDFELSNPLYKISFYLVTRIGYKITEGDTIALPLLGGEELNEIYARFPKEKYNYVFYENSQKVLSSFQKGKSNAIIVNQMELDDFSGLSRFSVDDIHADYVQRIAFNSSLKEAEKLFDKAFASFSADEFNSIVYVNLMRRHYYSATQESSKQYAYLALLYGIIIIVVVSAIIFIAISVLSHKNVSSIEKDEVTGLPTFSKFRHDVRFVLNQAEKNEYMLLTVDIDDFKFINNSYGFNKGNLILLELGTYFSECIGKQGYVCRFYADTFVFFTRKMDFFQIEDFVYNLTNVNSLIEKFLPEHYELSFSTSVYYIDDPQMDITNMIDRANMARHLKEGNFATQRVIEYTKEMDDSIEWNREITMSMNNAFENNEFEVFFQPKYSFSNEKIMGAEALIRWDSPEKGLLPPDRFVPLFERNGFIQKIDLYVFETVCKFLQNWAHASEKGDCPHPLTISFNLSRNHLYNPNLIKDLCLIKDKYDIGPNRLEVELTESIMFDNQKRLIHVMNQIKAAGYSISVDDFGSGYSSLNLLKDIPADVLKLDKGFLSNVPSNEKENTIISSVIDMSKRLKMTTVAEGVETGPQARLLMDMGCDIAQGYYYSKPIRQSEYYALLSKEYIESNET